MAQLPSIQDRGVLLQGARSRVTAQDIASPYQQAAGFLDNAAQLLKKDAVENAAIEGENSVFRDDAGQLQVKLKGDGTATAEAYDKMAGRTFVARISGDARVNGVDLVRAAKGNPDTFRASWKGFQDGVLVRTPRPLRGEVTTMLESEGARFLAGVSQQKFERDTMLGKQALQAEFEANDDQAATLALKNGTGTPDYLEMVGRARSLMGELVANPVFGVSAESAEIELQRMESRHLGYAMLGRVDKAMQSGGIVAARKLSESVLVDETLQLSPSERRQFSSMMNERIRDNQAIRNAELEPVKSQAKSIIARLELGNGVDNSDIDETARLLASGGDFAGAMKLTNARAHARFARMGDADQLVSLENAWKGAASPSPATGSEQVRAPANVRNAISGAAQRHGVSPTALMKIAQIESSMNPKAKNPNSSAGGLFQFVDGTASDYGLQDRYDAEQASDAAARLMKDNATHLRSVLGREPTDGELYLAHQQGAGGAAKLLSNPGALAVDVLGADAVKLNGGNASMTAGEFAAKWISKVDGASAGSYANFDPDLVKAMQDEVSKDTRRMFEAIKDGVIKNGNPAPEEMGLLYRQLAVIGDHEFTNEVDAFFRKEASAGLIDLVPPEDSAKVIADMEFAAAGGQSIAERELLEAMRRHHDAKVKALEEDPIGFAASRGLFQPPKQLDLSNAETAAAGFAERQRAVSALEARGYASGVSALQPSDLKGMQQWLGQATPDEQAQMLGAMGQALKPDTLRATASALAGDKGTKPFATASMLAMESPDAAASVLRGSQLLAQNPKLAPKDDQTFRDGQTEALPMHVFGAGMESGRQDILEASRMVYADLSAQARDESGEFNAERFDAAVQTVTGGFVDHGGRQVIPPRYGMRQDEFDALLKEKLPVVLQGAATPEGGPVLVNDVIDGGFLQAVGDGEYMIAFGPPGQETYVHTKGGMFPGDYGGEPLVLDLRQR